ncbi:MAG: two-component system repressor protein LuxO [Kangiellaceae bacterium]|jgi:two-component system repressor protein LuxO
MQNMSSDSIGSILLVDDEVNILTALSRSIRGMSLDIHAANSAKEGLVILEQKDIDIVISDKNMPGMSGTEFLEQVSQRWPETVRIMLTAYTELDAVISAINTGKIFNFMQKPWNNDELIIIIQQAMNYREILAERSLLRHTLEQWKFKRKHNFMSFIGQSTPMQFVYDSVERCAQSSASVFITGPSGAGKELVADAIHKLSPRKNKALVSLNCAAIPNELMESEIFGHIKGAFSGAVSNREGAASKAHTGTLFLDEIGEMDIALQAKILRFIQTGTFQKVGSDKLEKVDIRFISATNQEPHQAIENGHLREDLYYRLNVISIDVPPLNERDQDSIQIARFFLQHFSELENKIFVGLSSDAQKFIQNYDWPGNVRQLENTIHSAIVMSEGPLLTDKSIARQLRLTDQNMHDIVNKKRPAYIMQIAADNNLTAAHIVDVAVNSTDGIRSLAEVERAAIEHAIAACNDNVVKAAGLLEVSPSTLYRKVQQWQD